MKRSTTRVSSFWNHNHATSAILVLFLTISVSVNAQTDGGVPEQSLSLKASGLYLTNNPLDAPAGSLTNAKNMVIRRRGVTEPRRGQAPDAEIPGGAGSQFTAITSFDGSVIAHTSGNKLARRDNATTMTAYTGTYPPPTGFPTRFAEAGGALYTTTNAGLVRLDSAASQPTPAGVPPGLEGSATTTGTTGWLPFNGTVGYRVVWGRRDGDGQLMLGAPSGRILLTNLGQNSTEFTFTWARSGTTVTVTRASHGLTNGTVISVSESSDMSALPIGSYVISNVTTHTFDVTGLNAGAASSAGGNAFVLGSGARDAVVTTPIPDGISYRVDFVQLYRTIATYTGDVDPGESMAQVAEYFPSQAEITAGVASVTDVASYANGPTAYFGPNNGRGGLTDAHEQPPILTDMVSFRNYMFGVVQAYKQTFNIALLAAGGINGLGIGGGIKFATGAWTESFKATTDPEGTVIAPGEYSFVLSNFTTSAAVNIEETVRSLVRVINLRSEHMYAAYASGPDDLPGMMSLVARAGDEAQINVDAIVNGAAWSIAMPSAQTCDLQRVSNVVTVTAEGAAGFKVGMSVVITSDDPNFASGTYTITSVIDPITFTYADPGIDATSLVQMLAIDIEQIYFDQDATPGSWAMSSLEEPDAWPPRLRYRIEGDDTILYRITAQGDALLFWTNAGVYRLTGTDEGNFTLRMLDPNVKLVAPNTVQTVSNKAIALTDRGVLAINDVGVEKLSEPLDQLLLPYYSGEPEALTRLTADSYASKYETENEYTLFLPDLSGTLGQSPNAAYTYNAQTDTWVGPWRWTWAGDTEQEAGRIQAAYVASDGRLYLASGSNLFRERKARTLADYQDDPNVGIPVDVAYTLQTARNPAASKQWVESTVLLERPQPTSAEIYFTTEIDSTEEGGTINSGNYDAIRTYVPLNKSRSARLTVGLRNQISQQKLSILGVSQSYNTGSTRIGR